MRRAAFTALVIGTSFALPAPAMAHGLTGRADLPIPTWLFSWGAAIVLVISFAALAALWPRPRLEADRFKPLPQSLSRVVTSPAVDAVCGAIGVALLALVVWAGYAGSEIVSENITPTFIYVVFWLGLVPVSLLLGDVFRAFNPWRAAGRFVGWVVGRRAPEPIPYPERLGYVPAAVAIFAFAWMELVASEGSTPSMLATATIIYSVLTWFAMALYGVEAWTAKGEGFSVYFGLFSRLSFFERRGRDVGIRPALSGLARIERAPGLVALMAVMIGSVSFDGLSGGPSWQSWLSGVLDLFRESFGMDAEQALELSYALGLILSVAVVWGFYRLGIAGARSVDRRHPTRALARDFAHSLVPIALAYAAAHYVSLLVFQGQALGYLASDPLGNGSNFLGTASWGINYSVIGAETFWYLQLAFVVIGHVLALALAHDRALVIYDEARLAVRSQYWLLTVMVGFTTLALWLLSEASKG